jgi:hypothetical protein
MLDTLRSSKTRNADMATDNDMPSSPESKTREGTNISIAIKWNPFRTAIEYIKEILRKK